MRAQLRSLHSPDVPDLRLFSPEKPERFGVLVQAMIGPSNEDGEESFDFIVCTPSWLADTVFKSGPLIGCHHLIVNEFRFADIFETVQSFCARCDGATWNDVANQLGRLGRWEFEDYRGRPQEKP